MYIRKADVQLELNGNYNRLSYNLMGKMPHDQSLECFMRVPSFSIVDKELFR